MTKVLDVAAAAALVPDGAAVASTGVIGWLTPDAVLAAIGERHRNTNSPTGLTFFFPVGVGDAVEIPGMDHVARPGLMRRVVSGSYINPKHPQTGRRPALMEMIQGNQVEAYSWPIGATMHWLREVARRGPGYLTRIGLGTYIDPRQGGGRFTELATEELVEVVEFRDEEYLFYPSWPLDVGIIRASSADEEGNLSFEDQPLLSAAVAIALAVKASGGIVIAQVGRIVERGTRDAHDVRIPGNLVDHVVLAPDELVGTEVTDAGGYLRSVPDAVSALPVLPFAADKIVARRVAREISRGQVAIFGFGASSDAVLALAEQGDLADGSLLDYSFTTEHGPFGGVVMSGWQFSANLAPEALLDGPAMFDLIDGGGCPFAALAFAQIDGNGNVNVSKFGAANPGAGGFIDIAHNAERLVFAGTFTTGGLEVDVPGRALKVVREGAVRKFVSQVDHITYNILDGVRERGQQARVVTERAVFDATADGFVLVEIAPGLDVADVLAGIDFEVGVADELLTMDPQLFDQ